MDPASLLINRLEPHIFIETDRRTTRGLSCALARYCGMTRIEVPADITANLVAEQIEWVSRIVVRHFDLHAGILTPFGPITGYVFVRSLDDAIAFDVGGRVVNYFAKPPHEGVGWAPVRATANRPDSRPAPRARGILHEVES